MKNNKPKIIHFPSDFTFDDINKILSKKDDILYYTRIMEDKNEFHLIKYNENASFKIQSFGTQLLDFYSKNSQTKNIIKDIKIKGNDNFAILENISSELIEKLKDDFNKLLIK